jgi:putative ABC transport system ATP-binding protein
MIQLQNIRKVFNAGKSNEFVAIEGVDLSIDYRKATVLKGPSGSGKTTLLSILGCMARPTSGRITLKEREITSLPERFLTDIRRKTFGFMFQQFHLIKGITAIENVMIPAYPGGEKHAVLKKKAIDLLDRLNLSHKALANVEWLSGGEAQRIAIARALINDPAIIIADEPTAHLDTHLSREFMEIMRQLKAQGKTLLIASHDPIVYESDVIDRIIDMRDGKVLQGVVP